MDYRRLTLGLVLLGFTSLVTSCAPSSALQDETRPEILKWIKPDANVIQALSVEPAECLPASAAKDADIQLGRAAFRSPFLLGGQAARQGLTCQACHRQGQTSSNFFVVGLSEDPGTADVTNFHFSDQLGDEVFNPSPIPSLSDDVQGVNYDPDVPDLSHLVTRLITKEFNGEMPDAQIFTGILSYLRALNLENCESGDDDYPVLNGKALLNYNIESISNMFDILKGADYSQTSKQFMIASLRSEIGRIYSRYPKSKTIQKELKYLGQSLNSRQGYVEDTQLTAAYDMWKALIPKLKRKYSRSLFDPIYVSKWVQ